MSADSQQEPPSSTVAAAAKASPTATPPSAPAPAGDTVRNGAAASVTADGQAEAGTGAGSDGAPRRGIRSYVLRRSHFSNAQRDAYERLMPVFGLPYRNAALDYPTVFGRQAPVVLEIGFGMGDTTIEIAKAAPDVDFIAIDVHTPGVGALLKRIGQEELTNLRAIEHDAQQVLDNMIAPASLDGIHVFFPDPWPKARHHKRRLIQPSFLQKLVTALKPGGYIHLATDWQDYADQMAEVLAGNDALVMSPPQPMSSSSLPCPRPATRFERRGERLGHAITDLIRFRRTDA